MESYIANNYRNGVHEYRITLMCDAYSGHITSRIGGNVRGSEILRHAIEFIEGGYGMFSSDCDFRFDDEDGNFCSFTLGDAEGNELEFEDCDIEEAENYIVAVEIVGYEPRE